MFRRSEVTLISDPVCRRSVSEIEDSDFRYFDKDGFELNKAEQKFYSAMSYPIDHTILNHTCWQQPWFELEKPVEKLLLDHSMFLCRCSFADAAEQQLKQLKTTLPAADLLLRCKQKWGFDFALDAVAPDGTIYEVLHIEYDNYHYEHFKNQMLNLEWIIRHTDWLDAAHKIWEKREKWQELTGFEQNHWKSKYLINWDKSEYTEKSL